MQPFATLLEPFAYGSEGTSPKGRISSAYITYSGAPGALRAAGFSASLFEHFFDTLRFVDPKLSIESALYANGLHLEDTSSHLLVKNLSDAPIAVRGIIYPVGNRGSLKPLSIMSKSLVAGETGVLQLPPTGDPETLNGAAIRLESSRVASSLVATFTSTDPVHGITRSVPFADTSSYGALTGGYPWRIDGDYSSTVSITNIGRSRAAILAIIHPSVGKDYKFDTRYLEAGETGVFDIRHIRDQQIPDSKGVKLPKNVAGGQFEWSSILGDGSVRLVGRADVTSLSLGVRTIDTFYNCNCPLSTISAFITPGTPVVPVGGETSATTEVVYKNVCNGSEVDQAFAALNWLIQSPNILSLTTKVSPSTMKGLVAGASTFNTTINGDRWSFSPTAGCTRTPVHVTPSGTGSVGAYQVEPIATASQGPAVCPSGLAGWSRNVTNQVQYVGGTAYAYSGLTAADSISISTPNALGIAGTQTGSKKTTGDGSFPDTYFVCSPACPSSSGSAGASQTWTVDGIRLPHSNALTYKCSSITIDGSGN